LIYAYLLIHTYSRFIGNEGIKKVANKIDNLPKIVIPAGIERQVWFENAHQGIVKSALIRLKRAFDLKSGLNSAQVGEQ